MKFCKKVLSIVAVLLVLGCMTSALVACQNNDAFAGGFYYRIKSDSTVAVYVEKYDMEELVIPETIAGMKVTGVMKPKNKGVSSTLVKVVLPDTVRWIEKEAFKDCVALEEINLPDNMDVIYEKAFENCSSLTTVIIPDKMTEIGDEAFNGCMTLKSVYIPASVKSMGFDAFCGSPDLEIWVAREKAPAGWILWSSDIKEVHWNWDGVVPEA